MGMRETASRLIRQRGQAATLLKPTQGSTNVFGVYTPGPDESYPVWIFVAKYEDEARLWGLGAGWLTEADLRILVSTEDLTVEPRTHDKLLINGIPHEIRRVEALRPSGVVVYFECQARSE